MKLFKGSLENWFFRRYDNGNCTAVGISNGHKIFHGRLIETSVVVHYNEILRRIETLNSIYRLIGPEIVPQRRITVEDAVILQRRIIAHLNEGTQRNDKGKEKSHS